MFRLDDLPIEVSCCISLWEASILKSFTNKSKELTVFLIISQQDQVVIFSQRHLFLMKLKLITFWVIGAAARTKFAVEFSDETKLSKKNTIFRKTFVKKKNAVKKSISAYRRDECWSTLLNSRFTDFVF